MNNGGPQTPYLHLAYGSDQGENRNWDVLDQKAFDLARNLIANIPAGGDLTGFYPDPRIADGVVTGAKLSPPPSDPGLVLTATGNGTFGWFAPSADSLWLDDQGPAMLVPAGTNYGIALPSGGDGLVFRASTYPTIDRRTGLDADDAFLQLHAGQSGILFKSWNSGAIYATINPAGVVDPSDLATKQYVDSKGAGVTISATAPASPTVGQMWWRSDPDGNLYIRYDDGNTVQWVPATSTVGKMSGPAGGDLVGSYPNPQVVQATGRFTVPGPTTAETTDQSSIVFGQRTQKGRLIAIPGLDWIGLTANCRYTGSAWVADDTAKGMWRMTLTNFTDSLQVERQPGTGGAAATLLTLDSAGSLTVGSTGAPRVNLGQRCALESWDGNMATLHANFAATLVGYSQALPGWQISMDYRAPASSFLVNYRAAGGTAVTTPLILTGGGDFQIAGASATKASGTTWANPSDRRLKRDITDYLPGLDAIRRLLPRHFRWKASDEEGYGFVADEVKPIFPETVRVGADGMAVLDQSNIILALVNAVKELAAKLEAR